MPVCSVSNVRRCAVCHFVAIQELRLRTMEWFMNKKWECAWSKAIADCLKWFPGIQLAGLKDLINYKMQSGQSSGG
jgi:hypothetical protein